MNYQRSHVDVLSIHKFSAANTELFFWLEEKYRQQIIEPVRSRYYQIPDYLPVGRCGMFEKYGKPQGRIILDHNLIKYSLL